ncbi:MAG: hypothetical protein F4210_08625 [Holophagales bacterium]|nr:hypothetical protein [Holophagales bacterium]
MAIVSGLLVNFIIELRDIAVPHGIHGGAISLLVSLTLFFGISLLSKPKPLPDEIDAILDL